MNILQITNTACTDKNQATGVNRVVTQLCDYWIHIHQDNCYLAYFNEDEEVSPLFKSSFHIIAPLDIDGFKAFLQNNQIEVIIFNFAADQMTKVIKNVCEIARQHDIKVIYCFHFMPGYEGFSHGSFEEVWYSIISRKDVYDKIKKWMIKTSKPLSTKFIHRQMKKKYEPAYLECNKIVVFTKPYIEKYLRIVKGNDRTKFETIPNPLSFSEFLPIESLKSKQKEVIFVGRFHEPQKKVSSVLKIWKQIEKNTLLDDWTLSIIGSGKDEPFYHWLANRFHLKRVTFHGRQDPKPYYRKASILISTSAYEGWPMVLMEAMPMGCCCLAFDSYDAVHDIIQDGDNGRIIPNNNIRTYYKALAYLMLNEEKRIAMGLSAIESSKRFSMEIIGEKWRKLLAQ